MEIYVFSQFFRPEVQDQDVGSVGFSSGASLLGHLLPMSKPRLIKKTVTLDQAHLNGNP